MVYIFSWPSTEEFFNDQKAWMITNNFLLLENLGEDFNW